MKFTPFVMTAISAAALVADPASAGTTCYGFSGQQDGEVFDIGQTVQAEHLKMHVRGYVRGGNQAAPGSIKVQSTRLAGSKAAEQSELYIYNATLQIVPRQPVSQIEFRLAENEGTPSNGRHANLEINGKVHEVTDSLRHLDGREFADGNGGRIRVEVKLRPHGRDKYSNWFDGTMQVRALAGRIASFGIGSTPMVVDDVCFTPNAP